MMRALRALLAVLNRVNPLRIARDRIWLSVAKHRSLAGHPRIALRLSRWMPAYRYEFSDAFDVDGAPAEVVAGRLQAFGRVRDELATRFARTLAAGADLPAQLSDAAFVDAYRVPFQFRELVQANLRVPTVVARTAGTRVQDLDGYWSYDLTGAYGVNLFGADFYKETIERGVARARDVGLVLGPYHPVVADNVARLCSISGMDEVSFHMSGTEAVMQAVRLARYHTGRSHVVRFAGAYHGWSDGVQAGPGNPRPQKEVYTLEECSERTLRVLRTRTDIAAVLVNPLQAMSPNTSPATDSTLVTNGRSAHFDKTAYRTWLQRLREVCTDRGIALILDEVFLGFRVARGGVQEYFGVCADMVTYGKTVGGGLPVGVLCGRHAWMRRFRDDAPADVCFARGTFNAHPYVMTAMNEFLVHLDRADVREGYAAIDRVWDRRAAELNAALEREGLPVRVANMVSVWTTLYTQPGRYHWMFQYYLRLAGLMPSWIGSGRFIFTHATTDEDFAEITRRFVSAARAMERGGWWWADAALTNRAIQRGLTRELLRVLIGLPPRAPQREAAPTWSMGSSH